MQSQARAAPTQSFGVEAFQPQNETVLRWLGMAGFLINSRGTSMMIDPLLSIQKPQQSSGWNSTGRSGHPVTLG